MDIRRTRTMRRAVGSLAALALVTGGSVAAHADQTPLTPEQPQHQQLELKPDYLTEARTSVNSTTLMDHVAKLSVDIGPRVTGTPAERTAAEYVQDQLEASGYQVEFETFPVAARTIATVTSPTTELPGTPSWQMSVVPGSKLTGTEQPVRGSVVDLGAATADDVTDAVAGKIVMANYAASSVASLATAANQAGAVALILVDAGVNRPVPNVRSSVEGLTIPVIGGGTYHAENLRAALERGEVQLNIATSHHNEPGVNVIATRPASSGQNPAKAPVVMVTAHIDSVLGSPGANDDATGVSAFLESARVLAQYPSDTEIRIAGWGGEESGLLGSRAYANGLSQAEIDRFVGVWQMDMVGTNHQGDESRTWQFWGHSANGESNAVLDTSQLEFGLSGNGELNQGRMTGSDHVPFHNVGIPAGVYSWMYWAPPGSFGLEPSYHRPSDTIDKISPERLHFAAQHITGATYLASANKVKVAVVGPDGTADTATPIRMNCGDGWRQFGSSPDSAARVSYVPSLECTFRATSKDGAAASETVNVSGETEVTLPLARDKTKPAVTAQLSPKSMNGWHNQPVTVTLAASDDTDLAPAISYNVGKGGWRNGDTVLIDGNGVHNVQVRAEDSAGNKSQPVKVQVRIDTAPPALEIRSKSSGNVHVKSKDTGSGVDLVQYRISGSAEWSAYSKQTTFESGISYEFRAIDLAGNSSEVQTLKTR